MEVKRCCHGRRTPLKEFLGEVFVVVMVAFLLNNTSIVFINRQSTNENNILDHDVIRPYSVSCLRNAYALRTKTCLLKIINTLLLCSCRSIIMSGGLCCASKSNNHFNISASMACVGISISLKKTETT